VQPDPKLGVRVFGGSASGSVRVALDNGKRLEAAPEFKNQDQIETSGYDTKPTRFEIRATSTDGSVNVASVPAAPLHRQ
jgi:hypothetical protein